MLHKIFICKFYLITLKDLLHNNTISVSNWDQLQAIYGGLEKSEMGKGMLYDLQSDL